jgi:hypothetical protein
MKQEEQKALVWGAIGGALLTAVFFSRFDGALLTLLLFPIYFAFATMFAEGVVSFRAGAGFGERAGLGLISWWAVALSLLALFISFAT